MVVTVRAWRWLTATLGLLLTAAACTSPAPPAAAPSPSAAPLPSAASSPSVSPSRTPTASRPDHVLVVVFENKAFANEVGNPRAPYLNKLLDVSAVFTHSYAITHPSQPNYLALFSGSTQGVTSDRCLSRFHGRPNL